MSIALLWRLAPWIGGALAVVAFMLWINGLHGQIRTAQGQRAAAVLALVREQRDGITLRVNVSTLNAALDAQNASLALAGRAQADTQHRLDIAAREAVRARTVAERRAGALLAGRAGRDPCVSAMEVARGLP